ncbi:MAG: hypothetical protein GOU97_00120 [Nanoarchaeota archaeon]|nr:hypothetical protein [Nanoarchaeota archaeon]
MAAIRYLLGWPISAEKRLKIKELMKKHFENTRYFTGNKCCISAVGDVTPEGIDALLIDMKEQDLPGWHLGISLLEPEEDFLSKIPKPHHVTLRYETDTKS